MRLAAAALLALTLGCSWQQFDDIKLKAPVRALGRPGDMPAADFPAAILPVDRPRAQGELLVLGAGDLALADYTFDATGQGGTETIPKSTFVLPPASAGQPGVALTSFEVAAPAPATDTGPRFVAVSDQQPLLVELATAVRPFNIQPIGERLPRGATAIAAGPATPAGAFDVAVVAGSILYVSSTAGSTLPCSIGAEGRALVVGARWVAVATATDLRLPFFAGACQDPDLAGGVKLGPPHHSAGFGAALAVGDAVGDGTTQIAASAPADLTVHLFAVGAEPSLTWSAAFDAPEATTHFGESLAIGAVGGQPTLVVGDPGDAGAEGAIFLLRPQGATPAERLTRPSSGVVNFGGRVGILSFMSAAGAPVDLLLGSARSPVTGDPGVVYLFFRVGGEADPRAL
jgi:hypothetical protein